jgi:hypothetical protein
LDAEEEPTKCADAAERANKKDEDKDDNNSKQDHKVQQQNS